MASHSISRAAINWICGAVAAAPDAAAPTAVQATAIHPILYWKY